jgi:drug/metabolite transporter (DMT)-like permease
MKDRDREWFLGLHILLMMYSFFGIFSKKAAGEDFLSFRFCLYYGIVIMNLAVYAICWQQIIKRMPLVSAFANKAVTVIWGIVWGRLFFGEEITLKKMIGAVIIMLGIIIIALEGREEHG